MGFFKRKKSLAERFPAERLAQMPTVVTLNAMTAAKAAGLDDKAFLTSKFFGGYVLGFPSHADDIDQMFGARMRMMLFHEIFGEEAGDALHQKAMGHLMLNDWQAQKGMGFGQTDGERFFRALEENKRTDDAGNALKAALEIKACDIQQQL